MAGCQNVLETGAAAPDVPESLARDLCASDEYGGQTATNTSTLDPYDGFGAQYGYYFDWNLGLYLLGHRYYDSTTGRFINQDPTGMAGGINLYGYTGNGPLSGADPSGFDWRSWTNGWHVAFGFILGVGPNYDYYGPGSPESCNMRDSRGGDAVIGQISDGGLRSNVSWIRWGQFGAAFRIRQAHGGVGTIDAFANTMAELQNGTQAQVGAFTFTATRVGNDDTITVRIYNRVSVTSLFYHFFNIPGLRNTNWDRNGNGFGPFGNVDQVFEYTLSASELDQEDEDDWNGDSLPRFVGRD